MLNHVQTAVLNTTEKNKRRRKGRQRSFGNYNNWLIVSNNEIADIEKLAFI